MALVPIPWQPHLFLEERTLGYLKEASRIRGSNIYLVGNDAAWRSYDLQAAYFENWVRGKGPVASDPDVGQRSHMRGAAFDARDTDVKTQNACRAAGLIRDGKEPWHWNDPKWASMPIINARITVSAGNVIPLDLNPLEPTVFLIRNTALGDFLVGPGFAQHIVNSNVTNEIARDLGISIKQVKDGQLNQTLNAFGIKSIPTNGATFKL